MNPHRRRTVVIVSCLIAIVALTATIIIGCAQAPLGRAGAPAGGEATRPQSAPPQIGQPPVTYGDQNKGGITALPKPMTDGNTTLGTVSGTAGGVGGKGGAVDKDVQQRGLAPAAPGEELWVIAKPQSAAAPDGVTSRALDVRGSQFVQAKEQPARATQEFQRSQSSRATTQPPTDPGFGANSGLSIDAAPAIEPNTDLVPGSGQLLARRADAKLVPVPLKHTDVKASIAGYIATVDVTQQYHNPFADKIEAVYVFPLPENAAVNEFVMTIGDRKIRGIIRERDEAQRVYNEAKSQGYTASLLTQERPNIFTQSVANIEPGKQIDVDIKYFHTLSYSDGWFEFVFPMVVGPRFNPPAYTEGVGAKAHGSAVGVTGQRTEVSYLRPTERSGHDISLSLHVDAGVSIEQIDCTSHRIDVQQKSESVADVRIASNDSLPNKDFVLRYKVAGDHVKSALLTHRDERGGFFTLMVVPPDSLRELPRQPLEFVFTLDVSGSMSGQPIEQSRAAIRYCLTHMRPDDTFQIVRFASAAESMSPRPVPATRENIAAALRHIEVMEAGGGTMMLEGIRESLNFPADESRLRFVSFLTDGYIGNEVEILRELRKCRGDSRVFSFGVGSSPNRYLLDGLAKFGRGACAYLSLKDDASKVMAEYFERISHPALTNLSINFGGLNATDVYPQKLPDVFVGRPVIVTGRFNGNPTGPATVKINGKVAGEQRKIEVPVDFAAAETADTQALAAVWARAKLTELADSVIDEPNHDPTSQIRETALEYGLMSAYTAFVAVDSTHRTTGDHGTTVAVPVPVPEGVRYETTVQENQPAPHKAHRGEDELRPISRSN